jgi:hypothetical protein
MSLEIALLPGKGRGCKATTHIAAGSTIHISQPLATTVSQEWTPETCMWCFDFTYPKKQKVKPLTEQEQLSLISEWRLDSSNKKKKKSTIPALLKDVFFCSDICRDNCKSQYPASEWNLTWAAYYRLDNEFKNHKPTTTSIPKSEADLNCHLGKVMQWISIEDDKALSAWLDEAWECLTEDLELYKDIEDTDRAMCRLIASCIIRKHEAESTHDKTMLSNNQIPSFQDILLIQNNELSHFRSHYTASTLFPSNQNLLPDLHQFTTNKKELLLALLPSELLDVMALYTFFARAVTIPLQSVPILAVDNALFRSIFFRERANSFGLWENGDDEIAKAEGGVTDDLELLGWGIYPSAVYFNHSCDANVIKVRQGRNMTFIARRMIEKDEEACISYGCVGEDVHHRRARLLEHYHFMCQCTRCIQEDNLKHLVIR